MKCLKQHVDKQLHQAQRKERNPSVSGQTSTTSQQKQEETFLELFFKQSVEFFPYNTWLWLVPDAPIPLAERAFVDQVPAEPLVPKSFRACLCTGLVSLS